VAADLLALALAWHTGIVVVLLLRDPWCRAFGARAAYALWSLPPIMALAWAIGPSAPPVLVVDLPVDGRAAGASIAQAAQGSGLQVLAWIWALGVALVACRETVRNQRIRRRLRADTGRAGGLAIARAEFGPALFGLVRPRLVLPFDFEQRYCSDDRALAIAHELAHWRRRDIPVRAVSMAVATLQWFSPLAWLAHRKLVEDQELACDADVLAAHPDQRAPYARLIAAQAGSGPAATPMCTLHTHPLLRRISMIAHRPQPAVTRWSRAAFVLVVGLVATAGIASSNSGAAASPDYRIDLTVTVGDADTPRSFSATLGAGAGESVSARQDDAAGTTEVSLVTEADANREDGVTVALQVDANGQRIGAPHALLRLDQPGQIAVTGPDGRKVYTVDLRVRRWNADVDGR
jgi:beta-lactamase regulating signal transducer with metallopeptidase domain